MPAAVATPPRPTMSASASVPFSGRETSPEGVGTAPATATATGRMVDDRGRLIETGVSEGDRRLAIFLHLSPLLALLAPPALAVPVVVWFFVRDRSPFLDDHCRALLDAMISYSLWFVVAAITVVGIVLWPVLLVHGGMSGGIYVLALALMGERFEGASLAGANAAFILTYEVGAMGGPPLAGLAFSLAGAPGLPLVFVLALALLVPAALTAQRPARRTA